MGKNINTRGLCLAEQNRTACSVSDLDGWFAGDVRNQKVHGDILTVYVFVHHVPDGLRHHVGVQIGVVLQKHKDIGRLGRNVSNMAMIQLNNKSGEMWSFLFLESGSTRSDLVEEGSSCQDHGELTGVVRVVEPRLMVDVPRMIPPRETHNAISRLTPHSMTHHQTEIQQNPRWTELMNAFWMIFY